MSVRARHYVVMAATVVIAAAYAKLAGDWSDLAFYGGGVGVLALIVTFGNSWIEFAPDGAFRRRPRT